MQQQTKSETLEQKKSNSWGPTRDRSSGLSQLNWKLYAGAIITSEARRIGMQLKRSAKLLTVIGLTTRHAVCRMTYVVSDSFVTNDNFPKLIRKIISTNNFLKFVH